MKVFNSFNELFNAYGGGGQSSFFGSRVTDKNVVASPKRIKNGVRSSFGFGRREDNPAQSTIDYDTHLGNIIAAMELIQGSDDFDENRIPVLPDPNDGSFVGDEHFIDTVDKLLTNPVYQKRYNEMIDSTRSTLPKYPFGDKVRIVPSQTFTERLGYAAQSRIKQREDSRAYDSSMLKQMSMVSDEEMNKNSK